MNALMLSISVILSSCDKSPIIDYSGPTADWPNYGGSSGGGHFSLADQITPKNVHALEQVWEYHSGDFREASSGAADGADAQLRSSWQVTPLLIDETLYACTAFNRMIALDPTTGEEKWSFDPAVDISAELVVNCRGVSSWQAKVKTGAVCEHRIIMGTMDSRLIVVDAADGKPCMDFGGTGQVDLKKGLGEFDQHEYSASSPTAIIGNNVVVGAFILDRTHDHMPSGVVRAYDVQSGELVWYWDPIPPGQVPDLDENGQPRYKRGTSNVWSIMSVDEERDLVFLPTGNTSTDFYGAFRDNLDYYSSSIVALKGSTGELVWHYQMVHHDIWDYDTPAQPALFDFERDGQLIPGLAQPTKTGMLFLFNRETGEPLFPIEEKPVPQNWAVGDEYLSPTQPFPSKPASLHPSSLSPDDAWGFTFWDKGACSDQIAALRNEGIFTPPSLQGSLFYPSDYGGNNWGTPAIDPDRNLIILNTRLVAASLKLIPREDCDKYPGAGTQLGTPYCVLITPLMSPLGAPCGPRPWGKLTAIDLNSGDKVWERPLGTFEELAPWPISLMEGPPNIGGPAVTASGLTFIASTTDYYLRAFNSETGEELWKGKLPTGGHATPMTYRAAIDQKQYVIISAAGHIGMDEPVGDSLVAFALPD
jgi:quinoprotein glucose dehydrogenase